MIQAYIRPRTLHQALALCEVFAEGKGLQSRPKLEAKLSQIMVTKRILLLRFLSIAIMASLMQKLEG